MKLKRILAGIIACTLVASAMSATVFATDTGTTEVVTTTEVPEDDILWGDIDGNGRVDMQDSMLLARYLVSGDEDARAIFAALMDLNLAAVTNENGTVNIASVTNMLKKVTETTKP
ncbi:MAG: hypothetical protein GX365_03220, partial [Clostridiales bacterium]|nr:hypothetical protein [Clostridiales bacterium]